MNDCAEPLLATSSVGSGCDQSVLLSTLLDRRRSYRRLRSGPFTLQMQQRLLDAIRLTPAAFNRPPWHVALITETREALWSTIEEGFRSHLEGDRLQRHLDRLAGFRPGVAVALIFEDRSARTALQHEWGMSDEQASAYVEQSLGMLQLAIWLALTAEGLATSLQHWEGMIEERVARLVGLPCDRFRLAVSMPIGYADEQPRPIERVALEAIISLERATHAPLHD